MICFCGHVEDEHDGRCYVQFCQCLFFDPETIDEV